MQDTTKDQDSKGRRSAPIRIVETPRLGAPHAETLREVHSSLVRAGQNLYNLVQANGTNGVASPTAATPFTTFGQGFASPGVFGSAPAAPSFAPYGAASAYGTAAPFGIAPPAFGAYAPNVATPWATPNLMGAAWKSLTADIANALGTLQPIAAVLGSLQQATAMVPGIHPQAPYSFGTAPQATHTIPTAACDISDEGKQFVCLVDLPGLKPEQVELVVVEQAIVLSAYREAEGDGATLLQSERGQAIVQRTILLPAQVQPATAKATLADGVLTIALPKVNPTEGPRRVKVQG